MRIVCGQSKDQQPDGTSAPARADETRPNAILKSATQLGRGWRPVSAVGMLMLGRSGAEQCELLVPAIGKASDRPTVEQAPAMAAR